MRQIAIAAVLVLFGFVGLQAQPADWVRIYSKEYHFIAAFPEQPKESSGELETRFGKVPSKRWTVERPGLLYEISVSEFSDSPVKDRKSLYLFYKAVCTDLYGDCNPDGNYDDFDVLGVRKSADGKKQAFYMTMFLARDRFYLLRVVEDKPLKADRQSRENIKTFLDSLLFVHRKNGEDKFDWGLPASAMQHLKPVE